MSRFLAFLLAFAICLSAASLPGQVASIDLAFERLTAADGPSPQQLRAALNQFAQDHGEQGIAKLIELMTSGEPVLSVIAFDTVVSQGHQAFVPLLEALRRRAAAPDLDSDSASCNALVSATYELAKQAPLWETNPLWQQAYNQSLTELKKRFSRGDPDQQHLYSKQLIDVTLKEFARIAALTPDSELIELSAEEQSRIEAWIRRLNSPDAESRREAASQLEAIGEPAALELGIALNDDSQPTQAILEVLKNLGPQARRARMHVAFVAFHDAKLQHRIAAIETLHEIGFEDEWMLAQLELSTPVVEMLSDNLMFGLAVERSNLQPEQTDRMRWIVGIGSGLIHAPFSSETAAAWAQTLESGTEKEINAALFSLKRMTGNHGWEAIAPLRRVSCSTEFPVETRVAALDALVNIADNNRAMRAPSRELEWIQSLVVDSIEACLQDKDDRIRFAAAARVLSCVLPETKQEQLACERAQSEEFYIEHQQTLQTAQRMIAGALGAYSTAPTQENEAAARIALLAMESMNHALPGIPMRQQIGDRVLAIILGSDYGQACAKVATVGTESLSHRRFPVVRAGSESDSLEQIALRLIYSYQTSTHPVWLHRPDPSTVRGLVDFLSQQENIALVPELFFRLIRQNPTRLDEIPARQLFSRLHDRKVRVEELHVQMLYGEEFFDNATKRQLLQEVLRSADPPVLTKMLSDAPIGGYGPHDDLESTRSTVITLLRTALVSQHFSVRSSAYACLSKCIESRWQCRELLPLLRKQRAALAEGPVSPDLRYELEGLDELIDYDLRKYDEDDFLRYAHQQGSLAERLYAETHILARRTHMNPRTEAEELMGFVVPIGDEDPAQCLVALADELQVHIAGALREVSVQPTGESGEVTRVSLPVLREHPYFQDDEAAMAGLAMCVSNLASQVQQEDLARLGTSASRTLQNRLTNAHEQFLRYPDPDVTMFASMWVEPSVNQVKSKIEVLERDLHAAEQKRIAEEQADWGIQWLWGNDYVRMAIVVGAAFALALLLVVATWILHPVWIMDAGLAVDNLSVTYLGLTLSLKDVLLIGPFQRTRRASDAWVRRHVAAARTAFEDHATVKDRVLHVSMPLRLDDRLVASPSSEDFRSAFPGPISTLLIVGEGGSGKTSLACQLGRMAMAPRAKDRLQRHLMLPILIEDEFKEDSRLRQTRASNLGVDPETAKAVLKNDNERLIDAVCGKLTNLIGSENDVPPALVAQLLRQRRILLLVDHFSELSDDSRAVISPDRAGFPAKAMIVTSRQTERQLDAHLTVVRPLRVGRKRLIGFVDAYLDMAGARPWFDASDGEDELDLAQRLKTVVAQREVTVLIARMFLDAEIARAKGEADSQQPGSVPELMLHYISWLNRTADDHPVPDPTMLSAAKRVGWHCLKDNLRPSGVSIVDLEKDEQLEMDQVTRLQRLGVLVFTNLLKDEIRFSLDPLSEYLAALHFIDAFQGEDQKWGVLLKCMDQLAEQATTIQGFTLALYDCAFHSQGKLSPRILAQLKRRAEQQDAGTPELPTGSDASMVA